MSKPQVEVVINNQADPEALQRLHDKLNVVLLELENQQNAYGQLANLLETILTKIEDRMNAILADVKAQTTQIASIAAYQAGLRQQLADALAAAGATQAVQDAADKVFDGLEANNKALADSMNANTPAQGTDPTQAGDASTDTGVDSLGKGDASQDDAKT